MAELTYEQWLEDLGTKSKSAGTDVAGRHGSQDLLSALGVGQGAGRFTEATANQHTRRLVDEYKEHWGGNPYEDWRWGAGSTMSDTFGGAATVGDPDDMGALYHLISHGDYLNQFATADPSEDPANEPGNRDAGPPAGFGRVDVSDPQQYANVTGDDGKLVGGYNEGLDPSLKARSYTDSFGRTAFANQWDVPQDAIYDFLLERNAEDRRREVMESMGSGPLGNPMGNPLGMAEGGMVQRPQQAQMPMQQQPQAGFANGPMPMGGMMQQPVMPPRGFLPQSPQAPQQGIVSTGANNAAQRYANGGFAGTQPMQQQRSAGDPTGALGRNQSLLSNATGQATGFAQIPTPRSQTGMGTLLDDLEAASVSDFNSSNNTNFGTAEEILSQIGESDSGTNDTTGAGTAESAEAVGEAIGDVGRGVADAVGNAAESMGEAMGMGAIGSADAHGDSGVAGHGGMSDDPGEAASEGATSESSEAGASPGPESSAAMKDGGEAKGFVSGPGGPKDDKINAKLSDGEFVFSVDAVQFFGPETLKKMNDVARVAMRNKFKRQTGKEATQPQG